MRLNSLIAAAFSGGGGSSPFTFPKIGLVGTSLTQYGNFYRLTGNVTLTRDVNGLVSVPFTGHQIFGNQPINLVNLSDQTYEVQSTSQYIDANNFNYQTSVTGSAGTANATTAAFSAVVQQNRLKLVGLFSWLNNYAGGGLFLVGNYGQGADTAAMMDNAVSKIAASTAEIVIYEPLKNSVNTSVPANTIMTTVNAHISTLLGAGKKIVIIGDTPMGSANATSGKLAITNSVHASIQAIADANPNNIKFVNVFSTLADPAFPTTGQAYSWVTSDGIHWGSRAAKIIADAAWTAIQPWISPTALLPLSSGDSTVKNGWQTVFDFTNWTGATVAATAQGTSGTRSANMLPFNDNALSSAVCTVEAPTAGSSAYWQQCVQTPGATNCNLLIYFPTNTGQTIGSLGLTTNDYIRLVAEIELSGVTTSGMTFSTLTVQSNTSGLYGVADVARDNSTATSDDVMSFTFVTEPLQVTSNWTTVFENFTARFAAATASTATVRIRRAALLKKVA